MESDRDISSFGTALQAALVERMDFPSTALEEIILNLHQLHLVTQSEQREIVTQLVGLSIFGSHFINSRIENNRVILHAHGLQIGRDAGARAEQLIGVGEDSGVLRRQENVQRGKLRSVVHVAFLAGFSYSDELELHAFLPEVLLFASLQGIQRELSPYLLTDNMQYDPNFYVGNYLEGIMRLGYDVGKVIKEV